MTVKKGNSKLKHWSLQRCHARKTKLNSCLTGTCEGRVMYQILLASINACSVSDRHPSIDHRCMHASCMPVILVSF